MSSKIEKKSFLQEAEAEIIRIAGEAGARAALEKFEKMRKAATLARQDWRLRNAKLLLKHYREMKEHCRSAVYNASQLKESIDFVSLMEEWTSEDMFVESILRSAERTQIVMGHVDEMIDAFEILCMRSRKPEDERRSDVIRSLYIYDYPMTTEELAIKWHVVERTIYSDIVVAIEKLSALFFGVDGIPVA